MTTWVLVSYTDIEKGTWDDEEHQNETSTIHYSVEELDAIDNQESDPPYNMQCSKYKESILNEA